MVEIEFTNSMFLPEYEEFNKVNSEQNYRLLNVFMLNGDEQAIDENLTSWTVKSVTSKRISIQLEFQSPLQVSQGDQPDQIAI